MKTYRGTAFVSGLVIGLGAAGIFLWWEAAWYSRLFNGIRLAFDNLPYPYFGISGGILLITGIGMGIYTQYRSRSFGKKNARTNEHQP
jgi:hypothetical protein